MKNWLKTGLLLFTALIVTTSLQADDTCIFTVTADSVPPNVLILLDNGAEMENIAWHGDFDDQIFYSPHDPDDPNDPADTVLTCEDGNKFIGGAGTDPTPEADPFGPYSMNDGSGAYCNPNGYAIQVSGGNPYLRKVNTDLSIDSVNVSAFSADKLTIPELHVLWFDWYSINGVMQPGYQGWVGSMDTKWSVGTTIKGQTSGATAQVLQQLTFKDRAWTDGLGNTYIYKHYAAVVRMQTGAFSVAYNENILNSTGSANGGTPNGVKSRKIRRKVTLPQITPSATVDADGIKDNASLFRFTTNYLNWLLFDHRYAADGSLVAGSNYSGTGADLPIKSRFYYAKLAVRNVAKLTGNKATFGLNAFSATSVGSSNVQPLNPVVDVVNADPNLNVLNPNFVNNVNNLGTVTYSPLAEGLADLGGIYAGKSISGNVADFYCQKNFNILVSAGYSSKDLAVSSQGVPGSLSDYDMDGQVLDENGVAVGEGKILVDNALVTVPTRLEGSSYLDDVAYYLHTNDIIGYRAGFQNIWTYTVGTGTSEESRRFLINTSNNGNGNYNLSNTADPEYGRYHFDAQNPEDLTSALMAALNSILSRTATFTAPVVPVTRTTSGDLIYLAFFKPLANNNFWEGNITKFGLGAGNEILDQNGNPATWPNGAMRDDAEPYWATKWWGDSSKPNYMANANRHIYTFLGNNLSLTDSSNAFVPSNAGITTEILGTPLKTNSQYPAKTARELLMNYIRGADAFDADHDGAIDENRSVMHADALHGEPVIVPYGTTGNQRRMVYFSANDGMLHAVLDENGTEAWGFIPPDQLHRLRELTEGLEHPFFIDSSPKVYLEDNNGDGFIDYTTGEKAILMCGYRKGGKGYFALDVSNPDSPKFLWRMSDRDDRYAGVIHLTNSITSWANINYGDFWASGTYPDGTSYYVYGSTSYDELTSGTSLPYVWGYNLRPGATIDMYIDRYFTNGTYSFVGPVSAVIDRVENLGIPQDNSNTLRTVWNLGETWSEPVFTRVKTANDLSCSGDPASQSFKDCLVANPAKWKQVAVFGGGYDSRATSWWSSTGNFVYFADIYTGYNVNQLYTWGGSIPSAVTVIDSDFNSFADKVYVGDMGGHLWRIGQFDTGEDGTALVFPDVNENIYSWWPENLYSAGCDEVGGSCSDLIDNDGDLLVDEYKRFFYPPDVALEVGYDLVLLGSGDRDNACKTQTNNRLYVIKDDHQVSGLTESDLVNVSAGSTPNLSGSDKGFYLVLPQGDKALAEGVVFYKVFYITVFSPTTTDPCVPGGVSYLYSIGYKTGAAGADMNGDGVKDSATVVGGGIGSKPVVILRTGEDTGLLISVGSTNPDDTVGSTTGAGVIQAQPASPGFNFNMLWWREMF